MSKLQDILDYYPHHQDEWSNMTIIELKEERENLKQSASNLYDAAIEEKNNGEPDYAQENRTCANRLYKQVKHLKKYIKFRENDE